MFIRSGYSAQTRSGCRRCAGPRAAAVRHRGSPPCCPCAARWRRHAADLQRAQPDPPRPPAAGARRVSRSSSITSRSGCSAAPAVRRLLAGGLDPALELDPDPARADATPGPGGCCRGRPRDGRSSGSSWSSSASGVERLDVARPWRTRARPRRAGGRARRAGTPAAPGGAAQQLQRLHRHQAEGEVARGQLEGARVAADGRRRRGRRRARASAASRPASRSSAVTRVPGAGEVEATRPVPAPISRTGSPSAACASASSRHSRGRRV